MYVFCYRFMENKWFVCIVYIYVYIWNFVIKYDVTIFIFNFYICMEMDYFFDNILIYVIEGFLVNRIVL